MDRPNKYILVDKMPVVVYDLFEWGKWIEENDRTVAFDMVGTYEISTVFLGLDYQYSNGPPLLFETMVFEKLETPETVVIEIADKVFEFGPIHRKSLDDIDGYMDRYSTYDEAERGHAATVSLVRRSLLKVVNGGLNG